VLVDVKVVSSRARWNWIDLSHARAGGVEYWCWKGYMSRLKRIIVWAGGGLENWGRNAGLLVGGGGGYIGENVFIFALFLFFNGVVVRVGVVGSLAGRIIPTRGSWPV
jgi:hypothetical protein